MKNSMQYFHAAAVSGLIAVLVFTQAASAQGTSIQATQPAAQATQQANEPATQAAPQSQQAIPAPIERQNPSQAGPNTASPSPEAVARQRLLSAHTLYLARSTQDANFPDSPDDAYNLVLASLKNWGRFQIVDSLAQADLVLQLRDAVHAAVVDDMNGTPITYYLPSFQITVADPSTLSPLWTVTSSIPTTYKQKDRGALLSAAATNVVSQLKLLAGDSLTAQDQAAQKQLSHYYKIHIGLLIGVVAAAAALTVGLAVYLTHRQKANQDAFCQAHNIPPNMCLGG